MAGIHFLLSRSSHAGARRILAGGAIARDAAEVLLFAG